MTFIKRKKNYHNPKVLSRILPINNINGDSVFDYRILGDGEHTENHLRATKNLQRTSEIKPSILSFLRKQESIFYIEKATGFRVKPGMTA